MNLLTTRRLTLALAVSVGVCCAGIAAAQEPVRGGTLRFAAIGEPPSFDCASFTSITQLQYLAPHYSTLLAIDPNNYPNVIGDLAKEWVVSPDGLKYLIKLNSGIKFHDGSALTPDDVKATFERLANPPKGVVSVRKAAFAKLKSIEVTGPDTIVFNLSEPSSGFLSTLASPWNCIYSGKKLAEDPNYPSKVVMGSGPFVFAEYSAGAYWRGTRFAAYFKKGQPYLDKFEATIVTGQSVVNAVAGGQVDANFRVISTPEKERILAVRKDQVQFQTTPSTSVSLLDVNTKRKPFDDVRVRRALSLAIDRDTGLRVLGGYSQKWLNIIFREGHALAPSAEEIRKFTGFGTDIAAQRAEAKRLLAEAGVSNLKFTLLSPNIKVPFEPLSIFFIDQWRQIGATVTMDAQPIANQIARLSAGDFDLALDFNAPSSDDPTEVMAKMVPGGIGNYTGFEDDKLVKLYAQQDATMDPAERARLVKEFVNRYVELQYYITSFDTEREIVLDKKVRGWKVPPSYSVGLDLGNIWLAN